jgi:DNA-binding response OmpR family regulator
MRSHVLVVEDDPDILSSLAEAIREEGVEVRTAANGYQALAEVARQQPDLIFLDLMMPLMNGWKFMEELRARYPDNRSAVVLVSAVDDLSSEATSLGVTEFLVKPFDLEEVTRIARDYLHGGPALSQPSLGGHPPSRA